MNRRDTAVMMTTLHKLFPGRGFIVVSIDTGTRVRSMASSAVIPREMGVEMLREAVGRFGVDYEAHPDLPDS